jgi:hypothetical protein
MTDLILSTYSPSLDFMNIKYINIISNKNNTDTPLRSSFGDGSETTISNFRTNKVDQIILDKTLVISQELNQTYPQYKKSNKIKNIKYNLTRSFSFD